MKFSPIQAAILIGACNLMVNTAHAGATDWEPSWAFSGFGTAAYVQTDTDLGQFANPGQPYGADKSGSFGVDSLLGAQVNAKANSIFSATVQGISKRNGSGSFKPAIEWAFIKAQATPALAFRAGRIGVPTFMVSDYRHVNYSNLWVRPPLDVYGQVTFDHFDGADAIYQTSFGDTVVTSQAFFGSSKADSDNVSLRVRDQYGLNFTVEFSNGLTLRAGQARGKISFENADLDTLTSILAQTPFASVGRQLTGKPATFTGLGASIDHGNFIGNAEYTRRTTENLSPDTTGWALTAGYRFGKVTPFVVMSKLKVDDPNVVNTIPTSVPQLVPLAAAVDGILVAQKIGEKTNSVGVRWDAWKKVAIKAQFDRVKPEAGSVGTFQEVKQGFGDPVKVYTVSVDFVF